MGEVDPSGVPCEVATDQQACLALLDGARPTENSWKACGKTCGETCVYWGLVVTRGDEVGPHRLPDLFELALDTAVEGCVRETYGVVDAAFLARRAPAAERREAYAQIAADRAQTQLLAELAASGSPERVAQLGAPTAEQATRMARTQAQALAA